MDYEKCREILLRQSELVQKISETQKDIQDAVSNREWANFEEYFAVMKNMESELSALEERREGVFLEFQNVCGLKNNDALNDPKNRFYAMAATLPAEQRNDLTAVYRDLKLKTLKLRLANDTFLVYLSSIKASLTEFFQFAFPDRNGKMYTPQGTAFSHDMKSMVLNQRF